MPGWMTLDRDTLIELYAEEYSDAVTFIAAVGLTSTARRKGVLDELV